MSKISKEGYARVLIIKAALDSLYDKLEAKGVFNDVQSEFETIAEIVADSANWEEV